MKRILLSVVIAAVGIPAFLFFLLWPMFVFEPTSPIVGWWFAGLLFLTGVVIVHDILKEMGN